MEWIMEVYIGVFFAISGYHKLFNKQRHETLVATFKADGIPFIRFNEWFVPFVEFSAGTMLALHLHLYLTALSALGLLVLCAVATLADGLKRVQSYQPIDKADWLDDLLYLPETMICMMLAIALAANVERILS